MCRKITLTRKLFKGWKVYAQNKVQRRDAEKYCDVFYERGLRMRAFKMMKLFAHVAGNRLYEERMRQKVQLTVDTQVEEKKLELEFLEAMVKELEEQYRIELRKKALLKTQCDASYLRGVSAISMEALKMSHSTLNDYYVGMKMPSYDGSNIMSQIQRITAEGVNDQEFLRRKLQENSRHDASPERVLVVRNNPGESENKLHGDSARFEGKVVNQSFGL